MSQEEAKNNFFNSLPTYDPSNHQIYPASCHCGAVQYEVDLSPPLPKWKVVSCNCSICNKNGYLLVYPQRPQLKVTSGEELLRDYLFGRKQNLHKFCTKCGSCVFFDPRLNEFQPESGMDMLGVNVRMFKDVKVEELDIAHVDNRDPK